ncbi:hypothetical protein F0562_001166 [Nyssa sinensis]|uniref:Plant bHLH transcription factor ACT-like domain-containing protein n=1 Tax=Nyssa sinensis TaxID=561372 RepID=A0A5J5C6A7_9ASTE|nr:hypothetical protein F0562_001166 [Nyssa sinensis]
MVSKEHKRAATYKKIQLLRSITNSHAQTKTSIIIDASKFIEKLKQKVEKLYQNISAAKNSISQDPLPVQVKVEAQGKRFLISVVSERSCTGLLVFILETLEELSLVVHQARVSCSENFHLEAVVGYENQEEADQNIDAQGVRQAILQAIQKWKESSEQE